MGKKGLLVERTFVYAVNIKFSIVNVSNRHIPVDKNTPVGIVESKSYSLCKVSLELLNIYSYYLEDHPKICRKNKNHYCSISKSHIKQFLWDLMECLVELTK